jgi:glycerol-3-phosphate acyltransferase PlsY
VLGLDTLKGVLAVTLIPSWCLADPDPTARLGCGLAAVIGHAFPVFLRFRGGKGVATTIGVLLTSMPAVAAGGLLVWIVVFLMWRTVSVGSLALATVIPLLQLLDRQPLTQVLFGVALSLLIVLRHRTNITRLVQGTEPPFSFRREG